MHGMCVMCVMWCGSALLSPTFLSMKLGFFLVPWAMDEWDMAWFAFAMVWGGGGDVVGPRSCFRHTFVSGLTPVMILGIWQKLGCFQWPVAHQLAFWSHKSEILWTCLRVADE